jgi:hypothetical protein
MSLIKISKCKYVLHYIRVLHSHRVDFLKSVTSDTIYIVLDTNILLHHLRILKNLVEDIVAASAPIVLLCPGIVLNELDLYVYYGQQCARRRNDVVYHEARRINRILGVRLEVLLTG